MNLTPKQETFCQEYMKCGIASEAYRKAYPTSTKWKNEVVHVKASELLGKVMVRVKELQDEHKAENKIDRDWIIAKLQKVIEMSEHQDKPDTNGINKAVDTLNKMFGYYAPEKKELSGQVVNRVINVNPTKKG